MNLLRLWILLYSKCSANDELSEFSIDFVGQVGEVGVHLSLGQEGILEFHLGQFKQVLFDGVIDDGPGDLLVSLDGLVDDSLGVLEEATDALHHTKGLVEGTVEVIGREGILLQEVLSDHLSDFENSFLVLREGVFTDQLHDFSQIFLLLQDFLYYGLKSHEVRIVLVEIFFQNPIVV